MNQNTTSKLEIPSLPQSQGATQPQSALRMKPFPYHQSIKKLRMQLGQSKESDQAIQKSLNELYKVQKEYNKANQQILQKRIDNLPWNISEKSIIEEMQQKIQEEKERGGFIGIFKNFFGKMFSTQPTSIPKIQAQISVRNSTNFNGTIQQEQEQKKSLTTKREFGNKKDN